MQAIKNFPGHVWLGLAILLLTPHFVTGAVYEVGPDREFTQINQVPLENLAGGDTLRIFWRAEPYREKFVVAASATAQAPLVIIGVRGPQGQRPVLDGERATTRTALNFWSEGRGIIKVGGSTRPSGNATHIRIEGLEIRNARQGVRFVDRRGIDTTYALAASAIFIESGSNIVVSDCELHSNGNGFFTANASSRITLQFSYLHNNGYVSDLYHHNSYTESRGILFLGNRFGLLRAGSSGSNLKDRSVGTQILSNWIEGGNRQLDLVESSNLAYENLAEQFTHVYGNILIEPSGAGNRQVVHFGGDASDTSRFRHTLNFAYNTVISRRTDATTLFRVPHARQKARAFNNVFYTRHSGNTLYLQDGEGVVQLGSNWLRQGFRTHPTNNALQYQDFGGNFVEVPAAGLPTTAPLFTRYQDSDAAILDSVNLHPPSNSVLLLRARALDTDTGNWAAHNTEYIAHQSIQRRSDAGSGLSMTTVGALYIENISTTGTQSFPEQQHNPRIFNRDFSGPTKSYYPWRRNLYSLKGQRL